MNPITTSPDLFPEALLTENARRRNEEAKKALDFLQKQGVGASICPGNMGVDAKRTAAKIRQSNIHSQTAMAVYQDGQTMVQKKAQSLHEKLNVSAKIQSMEHKEAIIDGLHKAHELEVRAHLHLSHLPKKAGQIAMGLKAAADLLENPNIPAAETIVCDTGVSLLHESVNVTAAVTFSGSAVASAMGPWATVATVPRVLMVYEASSRITEPVAHKVSEECHEIFEKWKNKDSDLK